MTKIIRHNYYKDQKLVCYKNASKSSRKGKQRHTSFPSGKQRQKKSGRGLPTAFFIASVMTAVISTENKRPDLDCVENIH